MRSWLLALIACPLRIHIPRPLTAYLLPPNQIRYAGRLLLTHVRCSFLAPPLTASQSVNLPWLIVAGLDSCQPADRSVTQGPNLWLGLSSCPGWQGAFSVALEIFASAQNRRCRSITFALID